MVWAEKPKRMAAGSVWLILIFFVFFLKIMIACAEHQTTFGFGPPIRQIFPSSSDLVGDIKTSGWDSPLYTLAWDSEAHFPNLQGTFSRATRCICRTSRLFKLYACHLCHSDAA
jgi:hypothetical protein